MARPTTTGPAAPRSTRYRLPDGSRSAQSVWVWRGFLLLALIALGLCLTLAIDGRTGFAAAWAVIAAGWFAISMVLWRRHLRWAAEEDRRPTDPRDREAVTRRRPR